MALVEKNYNHHLVVQTGLWLHSNMADLDFLSLQEDSFKEDMGILNQSLRQVARNQW